MTATLDSPPKEKRTKPPGLVRAAAAVLAIYGCLLALMALDEGLALAVTAGVVAAMAAALWWGGRIGYWAGVGGTGLLVALVIVGLIDEPEPGGWTVLVLVAVPLALLLPPAARRRVPREPRSVASDVAGLPHPEGWTRGMTGGWAMFVFMSVFGLLLALPGLAMTFDTDGVDRAIGLGIAAMGGAIVCGISGWRPWRLRRLHVQSADVDGQRGVVFPGSPATNLLLLVGGGLATAAGVVLVVAYDAVGWQRVGGGVLAAFAAFAAVIGLSRLLGGGWRVYLLPSGVTIATGSGETALPWDAIEQMVAQEITTYARGFAIHEQFIGFVVSDPEAIRAGRFTLAMRRFNRALGADVSIPVRALRGHPAPLLYALRYYLEHREARPELAAGKALDRIRRGDLGQITQESQPWVAS
jgi:MFS family permease